MNAPASSIPQSESYQHITVTPVGKTIGAEISGVDLSQQLTPSVVAELRRAWLENIVIFFRDQDITPQQHKDFVAHFGVVFVNKTSFIPKHPDEEAVMVQEYDQYANIGADVDWHCDNSFRAIPQKCSLLYALDVPSVGGDTCWINMHAAYEALSEPVREMCDQLTAIHDLVTIMGPGVRETGGIKAFLNFAERTHTG